MRTYLTWFFNEFSYPEDGAAALFEGYDRIYQNEDSARLFDDILQIYCDNFNCDYKNILTKCEEIVTLCGVHEYTVKLLAYICLSRQLRTNYEARGLDLGIWFDSMCDLKYKLIECKLVKGIYGSFVADWFSRFFNMTRFALGRLQFEIVPFRRNYQKDGKILTPESPVINVHIPRTETPLDEASRKDAYARAREFYKADFEGKPMAFVCNSWLLFERHREMLKPTANIIGFMNDFDIIENKLNEPGAYSSAWRFFDMTIPEDLDALPEDSSLRRSYKALMKRGEPTGSGFGVFFA